MPDDDTTDLEKNPKEFLGSHPLIINVSPSYKTGEERTSRFQLKESAELNNCKGGEKPYELIKGDDKTANLVSYWCPYEEDYATSLKLSEGCKIYVHREYDEM